MNLAQQKKKIRECFGNAYFQLHRIDSFKQISHPKTLAPCLFNERQKVIIILQFEQRPGAQIRDNTECVEHMRAKMTKQCFFLGFYYFAYFVLSLQVGIDFKPLYSFCGFSPIHPVFCRGKRDL